MYIPCSLLLPIIVRYGPTTTGQLLPTDRPALPGTGWCSRRNNVDRGTFWPMIWDEWICPPSIFCTNYTYGDYTWIPRRKKMIELERYQFWLVASYVALSTTWLTPRRTGGPLTHVRHGLCTPACLPAMLLMRHCTF